MKKKRLVFGGIAEAIGCNGLAIVQLTDIERTRAICVVCDQNMKYQIGLRTAHAATGKLLPEVLVAVLGDIADANRFEINIYNLVDGEYKTVVQDSNSLREYPIRLSDAIVLALISNSSIFMEESLFYSQSMPYKETAGSLSIPINSLAEDELLAELKKAVDNENYRLASLIQAELKKRK